MIQTVACPFCGRVMTLTLTHKFTRPGQPPRKYYGCSGFPECRATCGAHPDGTPSSSPADPETKQARIAAHDAFDRLWKHGRMSRPAAYRHMQKIMGMTKDEAHIGFFSKEQCEALVAMLGKMKGVAR